jgi:hypothetical protein
MNKITTIELDDSTLDKLTLTHLSNAIEGMKADLKILADVKILADYQKEDIHDTIQNLNGAELMFEYFGGNIK